MERKGIWVLIRMAMNVTRYVVVLYLFIVSQMFQLKAEEPELMELDKDIIENLEFLESWEFLEEDLAFLENYEVIDKSSKKDENEPEIEGSYNGE